MIRKIGILIFVLFLAGGGFFYWQNNQKDIKELNKTLPAGVKVVKNIFGFGNEYKVINKIDGYEFKVPTEFMHRGGIEFIKYANITDDNELGYRLSMDEKFQKIIISETALVIQGRDGWDGTEIRRLKIEKDISLNDFIEEFKSRFLPKSTERLEIVPKVDMLQMGDFTVLKLSQSIKSLRTENTNSSTLFYFFRKNSAFYIIDHNSDNIVSEIIINGKW
ncbi:MAG: hypothetical protein V1688_04370 [bacterium]